MPHPSGEPAWRRYLRFFRGSVQRDVDDELRFHIDARIDDLISRGASRSAAERQAYEEFGDVREVRDGLHAIDRRIVKRRDRAELLHGLWQDAKYSARSLRRSPVVAVAIVLTLALGLGANAAMFSLLDVLYLRYPAGVVAPEDIHRVWQYRQFSNGALYSTVFDHTQYRTVREAVARDADLALLRPPAMRRLARGEDAPTAMVSWVSGEYFSLVGVHAQRGRLFLPEEQRVEVPVNVAVVSDGYWRRAMGASDSVLGSSVSLGRFKYTIVGVAQPEFTGVDVDAADIWLPVPTIANTAFTPRWWDNVNINGFAVLVRPHDGVTTQSLEARIRDALRASRSVNGSADTTTQASLASLLYARGPGNAQQEIRIAARLGGVAVLVLLIAVANVVNLLLARGVQRRREIAVRLALGVSRSRLLRLLVTESVLLAGVATAAAIATAVWGGALLRSTLLPSVRFAEAPLHWRVLLVSAVLALVAGVIAGLIPALQSTTPDLTDSLKAGVREGGGFRRSRLRSSLVAVQAALSVVLLVGAALFLRSLSNVRGLDLGFDARQIVYGDVSIETRDSVKQARVPVTMAALADRLRGMRGVDQAGLTTMRPMSGFAAENVFPEADTVAHKLDLMTHMGVSAEFFDAAGIRVVRGNGFTPANASSQVVVINESMAHHYWPGQNPIGRCLRFVRPDAPCYTIIGIVENSRRDRVIEEASLQYYWPLGRPPFPGHTGQTVVVHARADGTAQVATELKGMLRDAFPDANVNVTQMATALEPQYRPWKLGATLFSLFGVLALIVAAIGVYSTIAYGVSQRMHEFGVRLALGAQTSDVIAHVLTGALRVVALGVAAGVVLALLSGKLVQALLYGVAPNDPLVIGGVVLTLVLVAAIAALMPAWRAARVDPVTALRAD